MDATFKYKGKDVHFLNIDPEDHIESYLARGVFYEENVLKFIEDLQVEGNYLDAGAYIGNHSIFFSLFCPSNWVYSFEPQVPVHAKLVRNIWENRIGSTWIYNVALSDKSGEGRFSSHVRGNGGMATLTEEIGVLTVPIWTVDSLQANFTLMKIDVEGMELNVLRGAEKTLEGVEHLFVEIPPNAEAHEDMGNFLFNRNFVERKAFVDEQIYYFRKER
jgi:protein O-GlcNAc transferase